MGPLAERSGGIHFRLASRKSAFSALNALGSEPGNGAKLVDRFEFERGCGSRERASRAWTKRARPLAGPVVAAAAILPAKWAESGLPGELEGLNDSKQLTPLQRENFFAFLTSCGEVEFAIAQIDAVQIDEINILRATHRAMNDALAQLRPAPEHALVDGRPVKTMRVPQTAIVKGDARSYSIAAASVLAKVTRDRLMLEFDRQWPVYGFAGHKGYGTAQHLAALRRTDRARFTGEVSRR